MIETFLCITIGACFAFVATLANTSCSSRRPPQDTRERTKGPEQNTTHVHIIHIENIDVEYECTICLEPIEIDFMHTLKCSHAFHKECVHKWFEKSKRTYCPLCLQLAT